MSFEAGTALHWRRGMKTTQSTKKTKPILEIDKTARARKVKRLNAKRMFLVVAFSTPFTSLASVNMKDASYTRSWIDLDHKFATTQLKLERRYDSRSTTKGLFGFGWCSELDTQVEHAAHGKIRIRDCRTSVEEEFRLDDRAPEPERGRERIARRRPGEQIEVARIDGTRELFDRNGRLVERRKPGEPAVRLIYSRNGRIEGLTKGDLNSGVHLKMKTDPSSGMIRSIEAAPPSARGRLPAHSSLPGRIEFRYINDNLAEATNAWGNTFRYRYDELHNLTLVDYPDATRELIGYDKDHDRVVRFTNRDECLERYRYELPARNDKSERFATEAEQSCGGRVVKKLRYEFWYERHGDGKFLKRAQLNDGSRISTLEFGESAVVPKIMADEPTEKGELHDDARNS